jgi:GntR family transcriptional regulator
MNSPPWLIISQADPRPMYLQIKEQIRHRVAVGDWRPGQEIPSIRALAIATHVSVITVKRAYLELEREGVIVTRQGKGSFITEGADLSTTLQEQELDQHLEAAVRVGRSLGLSDRQLEDRLRAVSEHAGTPTHSTGTGEAVPADSLKAEHE